MAKLVGWLQSRTARELRWAAVVAGVVFAVAMLLSDFFQIASYGGLFRAISEAKMAGPYLGGNCPEGFFATPNCDPGWQPSISIRALGALVIVIVGLLLYRASRLSDAPTNSN